MSKSRRHRRLLEVLEPRLVLANYVVLDFTPDAIACEFAVGQFADVFAPASAGATFHFDDFNGIPAEHLYLTSFAAVFAALSNHDVIEGFGAPELDLSLNAARLYAAFLSLANTSTMPWRGLRAPLTT